MYKFSKKYIPNEYNPYTTIYLCACILKRLRMELEV